MSLMSIARVSGDDAIVLHEIVIRVGIRVRRVRICRGRRGGGSARIGRGAGRRGSVGVGIGLSAARSQRW